jgi:hypothetical protein
MRIPSLEQVVISQNLANEETLQKALLTQKQRGGSLK